VWLASKLRGGEDDASMPQRLPPTLSSRALNRAFLARQLLLRREPCAVEAALEHLVGLQAQAPLAPYVGLWSRLAAFRPEALSRLLESHAAVRTPLLRTTLHLVTRRDARALRPLLQPVLERGFASGSPFGRRLAGVDLAPVLALGRRLVEEAPRTVVELGRLLRERWPRRDGEAMAQAVRYLLPLVQVPPRGLWGQGGPAAWTTLSAWVPGPAKAAPATPERLVRRYLRAFGPASVKDAEHWSWLRPLGAAMERLRPRLRVFRDAGGRELFDLPEAPRPDPETPAPPRLLPEFDNALLSHHDRARIIAEAHRTRVFTRGAALVDGFVCGAWTIERRGKAAALRLELFRRLAPREREALCEEAARLLAFAAPEASKGAGRIELLE